MIADWKTDISTAPRGRRFGDRGQGFRPDWIMVCAIEKDRLVVAPTHFVEPTKAHPNGRWAGLHSKTIPHAWDHFPEGINPPSTEEESSW